MVRSEATADDSLAAILERTKIGIAMAAMIRIIATTFSNSIREKPRCLFIPSPKKLTAYTATANKGTAREFGARRMPHKEPRTLHVFRWFVAPFWLLVQDQS